MKNRYFVSIFAIFGAIVMISLAFVQPVTAKESGQIDILRKYDSYLKIASRIDKTFSSDTSIKMLSEKLFESSKLRGIINEIRYAKSYNELENLVIKFVKVLGEQEEYHKIEKILETRYKNELRKLEKISKDTRGNPEIIEYLISNSLEKRQNIKENYISPVNSGGNPKSGRCKSIENLNKEKSQSLSSSVAFKKDLDGNTYIFLPGIGWISLLILLRLLLSGVVSFYLFMYSTILANVGLWAAILAQLFGESPIPYEIRTVIGVIGIILSILPSGLIAKTTTLLIILSIFGYLSSMGFLSGNLLTKNSSQPRNSQDAIQSNSLWVPKFC